MPKPKTALKRNRLQLELKLQEKIMDSLHRQGWFVTKTSDRFKAGRPDLRIGNRRYGQMDVELKYSLDTWDLPVVLDTGLSKLQRIKIREMNQHGMPAIGLVYSEVLDLFFVTTVLREALPDARRQCKKLPGSEVISAPDLFVTAMEHLNDLGYQYPRTRTERSPR
jgi:hypothetical protein